MESLVFVLGLTASFAFALALARAFLESLVRLSRLGEDTDRNSFQGQPEEPFEMSSLLVVRLQHRRRLWRRFGGGGTGKFCPAHSL